MDSELHDGNQGVRGEFQEEKLANDASGYQTRDTQTKKELEKQFAYSALKNTSPIPKAIDTDVDDINTLVKIEKVDNGQEEKLANDESRYETMATHIKIEDDYRYSTVQKTIPLHLAIDRDVGGINQLVKTGKVDNGQEKILTNDESHYETMKTHIKIQLEDDYAYSTLENTSTLPINTAVNDINQLVKIEKAEHIENSQLYESQESQDNFHGTERLDNLHPPLRENSNIYIFENCQAKDKIGLNKLVEIINIKQEMKDTEEKSLEDYSQGYAKYNSTLEDTDVNERNGNNDLYLESDEINVDKNCRYATFSNLISVNGFNSDEKRDLKLCKRSQPCLDTVDRATSGLNRGDRSSVLVTVNSKDGEDVLNTDNCDMKSVSSSNIAKCMSVTETMEFQTSTVDSKTDPGVNTRNQVDLQHNFVLSSPKGAGTILNSKSPSQTAAPNDFHHPNNTIPSKYQAEEHTSSLNGFRKNSDKLTEQVSTKPDKSIKDFILVWKDQLININGHPLKCIMCGEQVLTLSALIGHICTIPHNETKDDRPPQCSLCFKNFKCLINLRKHIIRHSKERTHQCSTCGKDFKCFPDLRKHVIRHNRERTHDCNVCDKKFKTFHEVKIHMTSHSTDRPHQCNVCAKEFKIFKDLKQHLICHSIERPHQCNVCKKYFKRANYLKLHMLNHSSERPHQCKICSKDFKSMPALRRHMVSHSTGRPHQCSVCDKEFKRLSTLKTHMFSHNTDRPYQCNVCEKDFKSPDYLKQHMLSHSSVWQHTCSYCDKGFKTPRILRIHMARHMEGPFRSIGVDVKNTVSPLK